MLNAELIGKPLLNAETQQPVTRTGGGGEMNKIESISAGGTALTPDANKNVNIPYADNGVPGVVKLGDNASGFINNQFVGIMLREPSLSNLQAPRGGASTQQTILLQNIATAVKYALCGSDRIGYYNNTENTGTETNSRSTPMTDAEKELAQEVLGLSGVEENTIESISVGGTTVAPDANKNVDIPIAGNSVKGVVDVRAFFGNEVDAYGRLSTVKASNQEIDGKTNDYKAIVPSNLNYAVKSALSDANHLTMTSEEKIVAQEVLGLVAISQADYDTLDPPDPNTYYFII